MRAAVKTVLPRVGIGLLCVAMLAVCGLYLYPLSRPIYYVAIVAIVVVDVMYCAVDCGRYPHVSRTLLVAAIIISAAVGLYLLYYMTGLNERFTDFEALKQFVVGSGYWGFAVFIGLTVFQVVVLPIPAAVTILLGVALYGATASFVLSTIGTLIGSLLSFMLGKIFGRRLCNWMFGAENTEKYARLLNEKGRLVFIVMLLFPAFPDDMLCMIAGITDMSYAYFTAVCALTRPVMIGLTAYLGSGIIPFEGWGIPVWIALGCLMIVAFAVITRLKSRLEYGGARQKRPRKKKNKTKRLTT